MSAKWCSGAAALPPGLLEDLRLLDQVLRTKPPRWLSPWSKPCSLLCPNGSPRHWWYRRTGTRYKRLPEIPTHSVSAAVLLQREKSSRHAWEVIPVRCPVEYVQ